jgi:hypothetical protein
VRATRPSALLIAVTAAVGVLTAGCAIVRSVPPQSTDPAIDVRAGDHVVAVPLLEQARIEKLFVFFPGTRGRPDQYTDLVTRAAMLGYHAVSLDYENSQSINFEVCSNQPPQCHEDARLEILTGADSPYLEPDVDVTNSAFNRLVRLIEHEAQAHPSEGWNAFLGSDGPRWDRIAVGGHSQGGGHAAMTAKLHAVDRVLLFGATEPRPWTSEPFATPDDAFWGLVHAQEGSFAGITASWANIGLPGALTDVGTAPPAGDSHRLVTTVTNCSGNPNSNGFFHNCYSADPWMPPDAADGTPAFAPLWDHMLTE